jgi:hypothetical protein
MSLKQTVASHRSASRDPAHPFPVNQLHHKIQKTMKPKSCPHPWTLTLTRIFLVLGVLLLAVRPGNAQFSNIGISFDFNTPGQFTNTPYNMKDNDWLTFVPGTPLPPIVIEQPFLGVGNGGSLDITAGNTGDNTSILTAVNYNFSNNGATLIASAMVKIMTPSSNARNTQLGFVTGTNIYNGTAPVGINDNNPQGFMTVILQSTAQPALTHQLRLQHRGTDGGMAEVTPTPTPEAVLVAGRWYKLVGKFSNIKGTTANTLTIESSLQDMGLDGLTPGAIVLSYPPVSITNPTMVNQDKVYLAIRCANQNSGMDLWDNIYAHSATGDVAFVAQPSSPPVLQGRTATFHAQVNGDGPYSYQWNKNGTPITGANNWRYTTPPTVLTDDGAEFTVTVTGPNNSVTSNPAILLVEAEELAVVSAGSVDGTVIGLRFNQPVDSASGGNAANYSINGTPALVAVVRADGQSVLLHPSAPVSGNFTVTVANVLDLSGGPLGAANSANGTVAGLAGVVVNNAAPAGSNYSFAPGQFEITGGGADIWGLSDQFRFVHTQRTGDFDVQVKVAHVDVVRAPTKAGLAVRASLDPSSPQVLAAVNPKFPARGIYEGTTRHSYNIASVGWGTSNVRVDHDNAWLRFRRSGNTFSRYISVDGVNWNYNGQVTNPNIPETVLFGLAVCSVANWNPATAEFENYGDFAGYPGAEITISAQPAASLTVAVGSAGTATLTATVAGAPASELQYTWQRSDGAGGWVTVPASAGGTTATLNTGILSLQDDGAQFRAVLNAPGAESVISEVVTVTVTDTTYPTLLSAAIPLAAPRQLMLVFSEPVAAADALNPANYTVTNAAGASLEVASVAFHGDNRTVVLTTVNGFDIGTYGVLVSEISDLAGNPNFDLGRSFAQTSAPPGLPVVVELYMGIGGGDLAALGNMVATPRFQNRTPDSVVYNSVFGFNAGLTSFPDTGLNNFGARIYSYFIPTNTGPHRIYMRGDDAAQFWMNTNAVNSTDPAGAVRLMERNTANANYATGADQLVQNVQLTAGQRYYIEARFKEGSGGDGFAAVIQPQATTGTPGAASVIPGSMLEYPAAVAPRTPVLVDFFSGFSTATPVLTTFSVLTNDARWIEDRPDSFQWVGYNSVFGFNIGLADTTRNGYGVRLRSYFVPPSTGVYRFWIRADDTAQLWLNTNAVNSTDPSGAVLIASMNSWNAEYANSAQNISLVGGQRYYIEGRFMEGGGGDGFSMAVRLQSDGSTPPNTEVAAASMFEYPAELDAARVRVGLGPVNLASLTPMNPTISDGQRVTFTGAALRGAPPFGYYWLKDGALIGANTTTFTTLPLGPGDDGSVFTLVITNLFSQVEISSTVTVLSDETPPVLQSAVAGQSFNSVTLTFSEPLEPVSATTLANYQLSGGLLLFGATLDPSGTRVTLSTSLQAPAAVYTVTVNGVRDASSVGNLIEPDSTASFGGWVAGGSGLRVEYFANISGGTIINLISDPKFIGNVPDAVGYVADFGFGTATTVRNNFIGGARDNYGVRITGLFIAPSNGVYRFYIRSDDASQLWMNTNAVDSANPAGKVLLADVPSANLAFTDPRTVTVGIPMNAGQEYYIEALMKEGTGGDYVQVAFREQADPSIPPINTEFAPGQFFKALGAPELAELVLNQAPPGTLTVQAGDFVDFSASAGVLPSSLGPVLSYRWQRHDSATDTYHTIGHGSAFSFIAQLSDAGEYRLEISAPGAVQNFAITLNVLPDAPPSIVSINSLDGLTIGVRFSELVTSNSVTDLINWRVNGQTPQSIVLWPNRQTLSTREVRLVLPAALTGSYTVEVEGLEDLSGQVADITLTGNVQGFVVQDIGGPPGAGTSFSSIPTDIDVIAGGADIWGASDQGHFTLVQRSGDFDIHARLHSLSRAAGDADGITKAGIMVRETLDANARKLHYLAEPAALPVPGFGTLGRDRYEAGQRSTIGGGTAAWSGGDGLFTPAGIPNTWIRIKREGNLFRAFRSSDGVNWIQTTTHTMIMADPIWIGLSTTAHIPSAETVFAEYRNVYIPDLPVILTHPSDVTVSLHGEISLSVEVSNPPNSGALVYQWRKNNIAIPGANAATFQLSGAAVADAGVYSVDVGNDGGRITSAGARVSVVNEPPTTEPHSVTTLAGTAVEIPVGDLLAKATDPEGDTVTLIAVSGVAPVTFATDFNSGVPEGATVYSGGGGGYWSPDGGVDNSGRLVLTDNVNNQQGALVIDELTPGRRVSAFEASFLLRIGNVSAEPADGFSFNFADNLPNAVSTGAENGVGTGFSFCIDTYRFANYPGGGIANTSGMKLRYRGADIAGVNIPWPWNSTRYVPINISVTAEGLVTVLVDGTNVFGNITLANYAPAKGRFGIYARTGGQNQTHWVDDLSVTVHTLETAASTGASVFGSAYVSGGMLRITDNVNSQAGSFILDELVPGEPVLSFTANFKLRIGNGTGEPADGFSFNFANDLPISATGPRAAEDGMGSGFSFCVDNYRFAPYPGGGTANTSGIKIRYGGEDIAGLQIPTWNVPEFIPVSISVAASGVLAILIDGTNVFTEVTSIPWEAGAGRFGLYGRTGGQNQTHWVDDLEIVAETFDGPVTYSANFDGPLLATVVLNDGVITYTPPAGFVGIDTFYYIVSDGQVGGTSVGQVTVTVGEIVIGEPPVISACAPNQTLVAESGTIELPDLRAGVQVTAESGAVTIVQTPAPGTVIAGGNTTVTFTVSNAHGQVTCQATVRVVVPVAIANVGILSGTPNQIVAQIQTVAGLTYRIQMTAELKADGSTEWTTIGSVTGNGEVIPLAAPIGPGNAFFRIIVE